MDFNRIIVIFACLLGVIWLGSEVAVICAINIKNETIVEIISAVQSDLTTIVAALITGITGYLIGQKNNR